MNTSKATVTSKGQLTLPADIREFMGINTGDRVQFTTTSNNDVLMEKAKDTNPTSLKIISYILEKESLIIVQGPPKIGKNSFIKDLLLEHSFNKKVGVINFRILEHQKLRDLTGKNITSLEHNVDERKAVIIDEEDDYELIIIDNAQNVDTKIIKAINDKNKQVILIAQELKESILFELGNHFTVQLKRNGLYVKRNTLGENGFNTEEIYEN